MATRSIKIGEAAVRGRMDSCIVILFPPLSLPLPPAPRSIFEAAEKNALLRRLTYDGTFCQQIYNLRERARGTRWTLGYFRAV